MAGKEGHGGGWTDERVAIVAKLWAEGLSAGVIASRLGGVSRNAVIGKLFRLGLSQRSELANRINKSNARYANGRRLKTTLRKPPSLRKLFMGPKSAAVFKTEPYVAQTPVHVPEAERKLLADLEDHECRWPFGDAPFTFCARRKVPGLPYCRDHGRQAYQPPQPRRAPPIVHQTEEEKIPASACASNH